MIFTKNYLIILILSISLLQLFAFQSSDAFVNNQLTSKIIGNSDTSAELSVGQNLTSNAVFDSSGNLWVTEEGNNRVVMYAAPLTTGMAASVVLGQPNLSSEVANNGGISANTLYKPHGITFDSAGNLWVTDRFNNRVVMYSARFSTGQAASLVLGQGNSFTANTANNGGISASSLSTPTSVKFDSSGNLWVADSGPNRVIEYLKGTGFTNGQAASRVEGQSTLLGYNPGHTST